MIYLTEPEREMLIQCSELKQNIPLYGEFVGMVLHGMQSYNNPIVTEWFDILAILTHKGLVEWVEFDLSIKSAIGHGYRLTYEGTKALGEIRYKQWCDNRSLQAIYAEMYG